MENDEFEPEDLSLGEYEEAGPIERTPEDYDLEIRTLRNRLDEAQEDFDQCQLRCDELEEQSNKLLSAFIAASELQQVSGLERLKQVIGDIVLNIVGASQFVLAMIGDEGKSSVVVSREIDLEALNLRLDEEPFAGVVESGRAWLSASVESDDDVWGIWWRCAAGAVWPAVCWISSNRRVQGAGTFVSCVVGAVF